VGFGKNGRASGLDVMTDTMGRMGSGEIRVEKVGKCGEEVAQGGGSRLEVGEKGGEAERGRGSGEGSARGAVKDLATGRVNEQVVGGEEIGTEDGAGNSS